MSPLLEISGICKNFGGVIALDGVDLSVETGSLTCIIGPNGCGKTTLFNVVSGAFRPTAGRVRYARRGHHRTAPLPHRAQGNRAKIPGPRHLSVAERDGKS